MTAMTFMRPKPRANGAGAFVVLILFIAAFAGAGSASGQVANLRVTEVDPAADMVEVRNTGAGFTTASTHWFCHMFDYFSFVPSGTFFAAGESLVFDVSSLDDLDSDLWLYSIPDFEDANDIVHGVKYGPEPGVGRTGLAASVALWPSDSAYVPAPSAGMTIAWDGFGNHPADWYIDETSTLGFNDSTTPGTVVSGVAHPAGEQHFESMSLGDEVTAITAWPVVNTAAPGLFTVRAVADNLSVTGPRPGSSSTQWLRIRDQDAVGQNRFYTVPIVTPEVFDYRWTFYVNLEQMPPGAGSQAPRIVVQHLDGAFANAWGIEFAATGASVVVTGIGGPAASAPVYSISSPTGVGDWVKIELTVRLSSATVSVSANDGPEVSLATALSGTANPSQFRLCYRGEGAGNLNTMLLDDVTYETLSTPISDPIPGAIPPSAIFIALEPVATGLTAPNWGAVAPGDDRLFVTDQNGILWAIDLETGDKSVFLDVSPLLVELGVFGEGSFDERGLLGVAFHPGYEKNGLLYTFTSEDVFKPADFSTMPPGVLPNHRSVIREWQVPDPGDPDSVVDPTTARTLMRIDKPQFNHNAGALNFGPDGMLYISLGDGGGADDTDGQPFFGGPVVGHGDGNGQNAENILGSVVRIDPLGSNSANGAYGIPGDNPFLGADPRLDEIWAYGFRNPFRFSFDSLSGALWLADVGQNDIEEIDVVTGGENYGWNAKEGTFFFDPNGTNAGFVTLLDNGLAPGAIDPVAQYDHDEGIAIVGGFVYRGTRIEPLAGRYVFGEFAQTFDNDGRLFHLDDEGEIVEFSTCDGALGLSLLGFGQDAEGELYVLANSTGVPFGETGVVLRMRTRVGDVDANGVVGFSDLTSVLLAFGPCAGCPEDVDGNDVVGFNDLTQTLLNWGTCP